MISRIDPQEPQGAPAGWYPVDGGQRWWDGQQWGPVAPPTAPPREAWEKWATLGLQLVMVAAFVWWVIPWLIG